MAHVRINMDDVRVTARLHSLELLQRGDNLARWLEAIAVVRTIPLLTCALREERLLIIVPAPLSRIRQDLICLLNGNELPLRQLFLIWVFVRVPLDRQFLVGSLDVGFTGFTVH